MHSWVAKVSFAVSFQIDSYYAALASNKTPQPKVSHTYTSRRFERLSLEL